MPISNRSLFKGLTVSVLIAVATTGVARAEEPLDLLQRDPQSESIFESFFTFKDQGKQEEAVDVLRYAADAGNPAAQWKLGKMYQTGDGVQKDPLEAFSFFKRIAENNPNPMPNTPNWLFSANAFVALGQYYRNGIPGSSLQPDPNQARVMFTTAAFVFGHPEAQFELARMDLSDASTRYTARRAINMLRSAQKKGHMGAQALVGKILFEGDLAARDPVRGLMLLTDAKEKAPLEHREWISQLQEEAFTLATEAERRSALAALNTGGN